MAIEYLRPDDAEIVAKPGRFPCRRKPHAALYIKALNCHHWRGVPLSHIRWGVRVLHLNYLRGRVIT